MSGKKPSSLKVLIQDAAEIASYPLISIIEKKYGKSRVL